MTLPNATPQPVPTQRLMYRSDENIKPGIYRVIITEFGCIKPLVEMLPIKDGFIGYGDKVWLRSEDGPKLIRAIESYGAWENIRTFPNLFSKAEPKYEIIQTYKYLD